MKSPLSFFGGVCEIGSELIIQRIHFFCDKLGLIKKINAFKDCPSFFFLEQHILDLLAQILNLMNFFYQLCVCACMHVTKCIHVHTWQHNECMYVSLYKCVCVCVCVQKIVIGVTYINADIKLMANPG